MRTTSGLAATAAGWHFSSHSTMWGPACSCRAQPHSCTRATHVATAGQLVQQQYRPLQAVAGNARQQHTPAGGVAAGAAAVDPAAASNVQKAASDSLDNGRQQSVVRRRAKRQSLQDTVDARQAQAEQQQQDPDINLQQLEQLHEQLLSQEHLLQLQQGGEEVEGLLLQLQEQQADDATDNVETYTPDLPSTAAASVVDVELQIEQDLAAAAAAAEQEAAEAALEAYGLDQLQLQELQQDLDRQQQQLQQQQVARQQSRRQGSAQQAQQEQQQQLRPALDELLQQMQDTHDMAAQATSPYTSSSSSSSSSSSARSRDSSHLQHSSAQQQQQFDQLGVTAAQLTRQISAASHPQELLTLLLGAGPELNQVHLTAAADALLRLARQHQQMQDLYYKRKVRVCFKRLVRELQDQLLDLDPLGVTLALRHLAQMGVTDSGCQAQSLWGDLLHVSTPLLDGTSEHLLNPQQLSMIIHAVATADGWTQVKPSRHWYNAYLAATQAAMQQQQQAQGRSRSASGGSRSVSPQQPLMQQQQQQQQQQQSHSTGLQAGHSFTSQGYSNMVWALGKLQRRPGSDWAAVLYAATGPKLAGFSPQGLSNLSLGLANMNLVGGLPRPDKPWADAFVAAAVEQLPGFSSQGLANLLWSLAKLAYRPPASALQQLSDASLSLMGRCSAQDLSLTCYSFAVLGFKPPEAWWTGFWASSGAKMDQASSQGLANMFWALGRLKKDPPRQWLLSFMAHLDANLSAASCQALTNTLWAAGRMQLTMLPGSWLDSLLARLYWLLPQASSQELGVVLGALQALQHRPNSKWMARFYSCSEPKLPSFTPHQLSATLAALGGLTPDRPPPPSWASAVMQQVMSRLTDMNPPSLVDTLWGCMELKMTPHRDLAVSFLSCTADKMHLMNGPMMCRTLVTLSRFKQRPNASWLGLLAEESHYHLADLNPDQLADMVWGFAQLRYSPGAPWVQSVLNLTQEKMEGFSGKGLARLLQGLARLRVQPEVGWLAAVGVLVQRRLADMSGEELLQSVGALEVLGLGPTGDLVQQLSSGGFGSVEAADACAAAYAAARSAAAVAGGGDGSVGAEDGTPVPTTAAAWGLLQDASSDGSNAGGSRPAAAGTAARSVQQQQQQDAQRAVSSNGNGAATTTTSSSSSSHNADASRRELLPKPQLPRPGFRQMAAAAQQRRAQQHREQQQQQEPAPLH